MPSESPCFRAVTAFRILATAAFFEGYYSQSIPRYGTERRGAPVTAFVRIGEKDQMVRGASSLSWIMLSYLTHFSGNQ